MANNFFELSAKTINGVGQDFGIYKDKVVMVVNTASKCGFTPQYKDLEALYKKYKDKGFMILGFPCDQFAHQEPEGDEAIKSFCELNFGVTFPLMSKINVNGPDTHPVFKFLKEKAPGSIGTSIKWNFTKFLISKDGLTIKRYAPKTPPLDIEDDIKKELGL